MSVQADRVPWTQQLVRVMLGLIGYGSAVGRPARMFLVDPKSTRGDSSGSRISGECPGPGPKIANSATELFAHLTFVGQPRIVRWPATHRWIAREDIRPGTDLPVEN